MKFAVLDDHVLSFNQWINMEYGLVKKQFKMLCDTDKARLRKEYEEYKKRGLISSFFMVLYNGLFYKHFHFPLQILFYFCISESLNCLEFHSCGYENFLHHKTNHLFLQTHHK